MGTRQAISVLDAHGHSAPTTRLVLASSSKGLPRAGPFTYETWPSTANVIPITCIARSFERELALDGSWAKWRTTATPADRRHTSKRARPSTGAGIYNGRTAEEAY